jgi:hypothetical protein
MSLASSIWPQRHRAGQQEDRDPRGQGQQRRLRRIAGSHHAGRPVGQQQSEAKDDQPEQDVPAPDDKVFGYSGQHGEAQQICGFNAGEQEYDNENEFAGQHRRRVFAFP